jgi:molybdopterin-guanine dinucleotide biosynthesis protein A
MLLGIFVGGQGRRMGGVQKALLRAPDSDETLLARLLRIADAAGHEPVLLGAASLPTHGVLQLPDAQPIIGPLGGLASLLSYAAQRPALAVACDMPYVTEGLLSRLAREHADAGVLAPRDQATGKWQPLCARYDSPRVLPVLQTALAAGERSFQALFRRLSVTELMLDATELPQLVDWDTPDDMKR